jgi:hypothetical protein
MCRTLATGNNVAGDSTSSFQPTSRPSVFRGKNGESHRNNDERRPWQNQERNADQQYGYFNHGDDHTFNNLDVLTLQKAEEALRP